MHRKWFITFLLIFSLFAVIPGFSFYQHYFILLLPSLSILTGVVVEILPKVCGRIIATTNTQLAIILSLLTLAIFSFYTRSGYFFTLEPYYVSRTINGLNPFPESREIAQYIKSHSLPGRSIAVFGSEPQIYFYADRPSATDYLFMYPLVEQHQYVEKMQLEMIREVQLSAPQYVVFVWVPTSWLFVNTELGDKLLGMIDKYLGTYYQQVGVVELADLRGSNFFWDSDAKNRQPSTDYYVLIFKKTSVS